MVVNTSIAAGVSTARSLIASSPPVRVAIVGVGPKGLYGLERLLAEAKTLPPGIAIHIDLFERSGAFGSGVVYDPSQPDWLLANVPASSIDAWPRTTGNGAPPIVGACESLSQWRRQTGGETTEAVPRAVVGRYLRHVLGELLRCAPPGVVVRQHAAEVVDVGPGPSRHVTVEEGGRTHTLPRGFDHVLLATGHPSLEPTVAQRGWRDLAQRRSEVVHVPNVYPVDRQVTALPEAAPVGVVGMGLTFVDLAIAVSEGRGGRFRPAPAGDGLVYEASGREPVLLVMSRRGLPMLPRPLHGRSSPPLVHCTWSALRRAQAASPDGLVDVESELIPLLRREMRWAHAATMLGLDRRDPPHMRDLDRIVAQHHDRHPRSPRFDVEVLLDPLGLSPPTSAAAYERRAREWLRAAVAEARLDEDTSPVLAAAAVWRSAADVFRAALDDNGATPESHRRFAEHHHPRLTRIAFGPPTINGEKLLALVEAGVVRFEIGPDARVEADTDSWTLSSPTTGARRTVGALVDARIPPMDLERIRSPLLQHLRERGEVAAHVVTGRGQEPHRPGGIALVPGTGRVVDSTGMPSDGLTASGTPTEGARYDNDALSRDRHDTVTAWAQMVCATARSLGASS